MQNGAMQSQPHEYMTNPEAAEYVRIHPAHLQKLCRLGRGPRVIRLGRAVRYSRDDLNTWMSSHAIAPNAETALPTSLET
jgi:excisionase family DNA binding protein